MDNKKSIAGMILFFTLVIAGCKKWDDHIAVTQQDLNTNLLQAVAANPDLSKFRDYVGQAGLDSVLEATKTFTVWAPTNAALQTIDPAIVADKEKLKAFILNHISNQLYFTKDVVTTARIQMLNGKYNNFSATKFDVAGLASMDKYVSNGVLHTINAFVPPLQNIWEFVNATTGQYAQSAFMVSLNYNAFDPSKAIIDSISAITGLPVYRPGTGIVQRNYFNDRVYDLKREDKEYTYFVIQDANFIVEADSLKNYFSTAIAATTDSLTRWNTVKELAHDTLLLPPLSASQALVSKSGVSMVVSNAFVVETKRFSNGNVYIMSKLDVPTKNKFLPITIQGENPTGFLQNDRTAFINYRARLNPVSKINFADLLVSGHAVTTFYSYYRLNEMPSIKYQVYALGTNDFQAAAFSQTLIAWHTGLLAPQPTLTGTTSGTSLTHAVPLSSAPTGAYDEKYLGDVIISKFGTIDWRLTSVTTGPILMDYIRLVPVP